MGVRRPVSAGVCTKPLRGCCELLCDSWSACSLNGCPGLGCPRWPSPTHSLMPSPTCEGHRGAEGPGHAGGCSLSCPHSPALLRPPQLHKCSGDGSQRWCPGPRMLSFLGESPGWALAGRCGSPQGPRGAGGAAQRLPPTNLYIPQSGREGVLEKELKSRISVGIPTGFLPVAVNRVLSAWRVGHACNPRYAGG